MTDPSDGSDGGDDGHGDDDSDNSGDTDDSGPWLLALGVGLIGVVAALVEGTRIVRERLRRNDEQSD